VGRILSWGGDKGDLENLPAAGVFPRKDGTVWVVYPRGCKDIRESDVMAAGKSVGLTDNKVARLSRLTQDFDLWCRWLSASRNLAV
jgi:hypothetical protein